VHKNWKKLSIVINLPLFIGTAKRGTSVRQVLLRGYNPVLRMTCLLKV
jgi:hypothetical protein